MFRFGDCEIREISFAHPDMRIRLFDQVNGTSRLLLCRDVAFCLFETDRPQNIVEDIHVFDNLEAAFKNAEFTKFVSSRHADSALRDRFEHGRIVFVQPITSGDCIVACTSVSIVDTV